VQRIFAAQGVAQVESVADKGVRHLSPEDNSNQPKPRTPLHVSLNGRLRAGSWSEQGGWRALAVECSRPWRERQRDVVNNRRQAAVDATLRLRARRSLRPASAWSFCPDTSARRGAGCAAATEWRGHYDYGFVTISSLKSCQT